jgi:hypothetical protein
MLKIDVEAIARAYEDAGDEWWATHRPLGMHEKFVGRDIYSRRGRGVAIRAALGELARQARVAGRQFTDGPHGPKEWVYAEELEAAAEAPDTSALDEARRKLREAEDAQGKAAEAVRAARAQVDAIERG